MMPRYNRLYRVVTEFSSIEDAPTLIDGKQILFQTNNYQEARKECIEWAAYDDILAQVHKGWNNSNAGHIVFQCDGASEAYNRYPKTAFAPWDAA
jgi:hypothetical protein